MLSIALLKKIVNLVDNGSVTYYNTYRKKCSGWEDMKETDLISLISEKQRAIRRTCQSMWEGTNEIHISDTEWAVLFLSLESMVTISEAAKNLGISRQASHKVARSMEEKGLVTIHESEIYKNRKYIIPSDLGKKYAEEQTRMKNSLVQKIEQTVGAENARNLKEILAMDWGLEYE